MTFWPVVKIIAFYAKLIWLLFGQLLEKLGLLLISTFCHTGPIVSLAENVTADHEMGN